MTAGVVETGTILDRIVAQTAVDLERRKRILSQDRLREQAKQAPAPLDVRAFLRRQTVSIIAEFKRASPSRGRLPVEIDPGEVARDYIDGGATAISCLTDEPFFQGSLADLDAVVSVTRAAARPVGVLRKDFMIDCYQVDEACAHGASCILLIVACLDDDQLCDLHAYARSLGLSVLVEVHDERELDRALAVGSSLVGINNRNLHTFAVDLSVTSRLAPRVPPDVVLVGESGIFTREHVRAMGEAGIDAVLIGESLILQHDRSAATEALCGVGKVTRG